MTLHDFIELAIGAGAISIPTWFAARKLNQVTTVFPTLIPPRSAPMTLDPQKKSYVEGRLAAYSAALPHCPTKTLLLVIAQGAYESGWGKSAPAARGFNDWNLTAGSSWKGGVLNGGDTEFVAGVVAPRKIVQRFRQYDSTAASIIDFFRFLSTPRYADALAKLNAGDAGFVAELGAFKYGADGKTAVPAWPAGVVKGGFYTLPIEKYVRGFTACYEQVEQVRSSSTSPSSTSHP